MAVSYDSILLNLREAESIDRKPYGTSAAADLSGKWNINRRSGFGL
jgi:hypothetical protein